jgi:thiamine-monophosphate kinase
MDVSDGLAGDLAKLCAVSGVGARIHADKLPLSIRLPEAEPDRLRLLRRIATGGDDYELLVVLPRPALAELSAAADRAGIAVAPIGEIVQAADGVKFHDGAGRPLPISLAGFSHFGE